MTNTKIFLFIGTSLSFLPQLTFAQCVATQDCATLGYTETSCSGGNGVKCPFGNKWACFKSESEIKNQLCSELGFTLSCTGTNQIGVGKACNGKYTECTCATGYIWNDSSQKCENPYANCVIGALYYSDGTCSQDKLSSKTLLGVVIYEKSASQNGWIMTVKPVKTAIAWGVYGTATGIRDKAVSASCTNTQKLVAKGSDYEAAITANNYKPTGTPSGKSWCLPSYDLLNNLNNSVNFAKVNAGSTPVPARGASAPIRVVCSVCTATLSPAASTTTPFARCSLSKNSPGASEARPRCPCKLCQLHPLTLLFGDRGREVAMLTFCPC